MANTVYIIMRDHYPLAVFEDYKKAIKFKETQDLLNPKRTTTTILQSAILDDCFDLHTEVKKYFKYTLNSDDTIEQADTYNTREKEPKIFNGSQFVELKYNNEPYIDIPYYTIAAYSINTYNEARTIALEQYERLKK